MATSTNARRRKAAPEATPTPEDMTPRHMRKPSTFKRILRMILLILVVIAATVGATIYYTWPTSASVLGLGHLFNSEAENTAVAAAPTPQPVAPSRPEPIPIPSASPVFANLAPFTVTISEGGARSRILHVAITAQLLDEPSAEILKEYNPVVRDRVLRILSEQHPGHIQTPDGRKQLVDHLIHALSSPYGGPYTAPRIQNVLFTAFVIQ